MQLKLISFFWLFFLMGSLGFAQDAIISQTVKDQFSVQEEASFFVVLRDHGNILEDIGHLAKTEKGRKVFLKLRQAANNSQQALKAELKAKGISFKSFIIVNAILVKGDVSLLNTMAKHPDIAQILPNEIFTVASPIEEKEGFQRSIDELPWGLELIGADQVWNMGFRGQGVIVGGQDTGYEWDHPALINNYRGFAEGVVDHNYNWHDAIRELNPNHNDPDSVLQPNPCGLGLVEPCDDLASHGTHTMGIAVGYDPEQEMIIGVAPEAKWIGARNMDRGIGTPQTYLEAFEWFLAPTDLNGENPNPDLSPHVITNSWSCPEKEGCNPDNFHLLENAINNLKSAGIMVVASAGNNGTSGCASIYNPPAIFENTFTIGSIDSNDSLSSFSSKGPVEIDASGRIKPNVSAPGRGVLSSVTGGGYGMKSGTSMASPHVAGLVALMLSAAPELAGNVEAIEDIIEKTAVQKIEPDSCTDGSRSEIPNMLHGYGRIDALEAVREVLALTAVHHEEKNASLTVYPNPAKDYIYIRQSSDLSGKLQFFSLDGKQIYERDLSISGVEKISTASWPPGLYTYRFAGSAEIKTGKLIIGSK